jgi:hypothetical protein
MLVTEYLDRLIFPPESRDKMLAKYRANAVEASLENVVALASLRAAKSRGFVAEPEATDWAVYPIDRLADPRPTDMLHTRANASLVSASLSGRLLKATFAESISSVRVALVDYEFQLAPRSAQGVLEAHVIKRTVSPRGFEKRPAGSGANVWGSVGIGDVSNDRTKVIRGNKVFSLIDGSFVEHETGRFASNVDFFFIGNDLYRTVPRAFATSTFEDAERAPYLGITKFVNGKWVRVSDLILEAISANGRYAVVKQLPKERDGLPTRFVVKLK